MGECVCPLLMQFTVVKAESGLGPSGQINLTISVQLGTLSEHSDDFNVLYFGGRVRPLSGTSSLNSCPKPLVNITMACSVTVQKVPYRRQCALCFLRLYSIILPVSPTHSLPHVTCYLIHTTL